MENHFDLPPLKFKKLHPDAILPTKATPGSIGYDLYNVDEKTLNPGDYALFSTGLAMVLPQYGEGQIRPRSGLAAKFGVTVLNAPGTIDTDFHGEIKVILINHGRNPVNIQKGDRIAQLVIAGTASDLPVVEIQELPTSDRGNKGFGSSGK